MSCALDELRSRQRLIEELGLKGLQARENAELKQKLVDLNARNKSHQELARLRKSQMGVLQEQYEKALAQSRQYKQAMEEAKARVASLMRAMQGRPGGAGPTPCRAPTDTCVGSGGSGFRRQVTGRRMIRSPTHDRQGSPTSPRTVTTRTSGRTEMTSLLGSAPSTRLNSTEETHGSRHGRDDDDVKTKISDEDGLYDDRRSSTRRGTILPPVQSRNARFHPALPLFIII